MEDVLFYNSIHTIITIANIKTTQYKSKSLFLSFFIIIINFKNLRPNVNYKKKAITSIVQHI